MRLLLYLAWKTLVRSRLSFVLLLAAVTAGLGFQIPNTANLDGYTAELRHKGISRGSGHVFISSPKGGAFTGGDDLAARVAAEPYVRAVVTRLVHVGTIFAGEKTHTTRVVGIEPQVEDRATDFCKNIAEGRCISVDEARSAVLGARIAERIGARVGDTVKMALPVARGDDLRMISSVFRVEGIARGFGGFQSDWDVFVAIGAVRELFGEPGGASELMVYVHDDENAGEHARRINALASDRRVEPWWEANTFVKSAIDGNRAIASISTAMVVCAVMIPVLALLYIHVLHERRRIATIAALGFARREIFLIHLFEALFVGGIGVGLGCGVGFGLCRYFHAHPIFSHDGFVVVPAMTLHAFAVPSLILFATTLLAGIVPAVIASRAEPSIELRHE